MLKYLFMGMMIFLSRLNVLKTKNILATSSQARGRKKARQGVVGQCRARGIYYKREKKVDTRMHFLSNRP